MSGEKMPPSAEELLALEKVEKEKEAIIKAQKDFEDKVKEANKVLAETLQRLGLTLEVEHKIVYKPIK